MTALPMLAQYFRDLGLPEELVAVAPDTGRTRLASKFAEMIGGDLAVLQKDRPAHNVAHITNVIGDVDGKCAVMTDDMVDTRGTLVAGRAVPQGARREEGLRVRDARHLLAAAIERIEESPLDRSSSRTRCRSTR
jgi:ribose-phosphate pyrophosphokinase